MEDEVLYGYHATDQSNVESILKNGFRAKPNQDHWLGTGVYFFVDPALARQWGTNPTKKYSEIEKVAFLKVQIETDGEFIWDMRLLDDYNGIKKAFDDFISTINNRDGQLQNYTSPMLRNAFFNWFTRKMGVKCIIGNFGDRINLSEKIKYEDAFNSKLKMPYVETQICVIDTTIIVRTLVVDLERG